MYKIGDQIEEKFGRKRGKFIIFGFTRNKNSCVAKSLENRILHDGDVEFFWYDDYNEKIPYIKGNNYIFLSLRDCILLNIKEESIYDIY